jgi:hypothetical protein
MTTSADNPSAVTRQYRERKHMTTGTVERVKFNPREERPKTRLVEDGDYTLSIGDAGKPGLHGWSKPTDPKKYPSRKMSLTIEGTEDELDPSKPKKMNYWLSASPKATSMIWDFARAFGYPEEVSLPVLKSPRDPAVREALGEIDKIFTWAVENERTAKAELNQTKGATGGVFNNIAQWHPAEEFVEESSEQEGDGGGLVEELLEEAQVEEETPEPPPPAKTTKGKPTPAKKSGKK